MDENYPQLEVQENAPCENSIEKVRFEVNEVLKGYIVNIGCQTLALTDVNDVSIVVSYYLNNNQECHRAYLEGKLTDLVNKVLGN